MKNSLTSLATLIGLFLSLTPTLVQAQQHRATLLGNPATRFALPLQKPDDLRLMLCSNAIRADVDFIARESGFQGDLADLRRAASNAVIVEIKIPIGSRLPAMSSRKNGKPILLQDVLWAGKAPIDAYEFFFSSQGRRYRVVSPKACANFWIEDFGKEGRAELTLTCHAMEEVLPLRPAVVCLTARNSGDASASLTTVTLAIPTNATFVSATAGGEAFTNQVVWKLAKLPVGASNQLCATFNSATPGLLAFTTTLRSGSATASTECVTRVKGVPAVLLEVIDLEDPIEVGTNETYEVLVTNQGSETLTNLKVVCHMEESQAFDSGSGSTPIKADARVITTEILPQLKSKENAAWKIIVKTLQAGDVRFTTELNCDQFTVPIKEVEATQQY